MDPLQWNSIILFMSVVFDKSTLFFSQHYLFYLEDMILRKFETDALTLEETSHFLYYFALSQFENREILRLVMESVNSNIMRDPDDEQFLAMGDLFNVLDRLVCMTKIPGIPRQAVEVPLKRIRGFLGRNEGLLSRGERSRLEERIGSRLALEE